MKTTYWVPKEQPHKAFGLKYIYKIENSRGYFKSMEGIMWFRSNMNCKEIRKNYKEISEGDYMLELI